MGPGDGLPGPTDSWITLAGLARETSRIRLGTLVTAATFRLPGVLAIQVAQVDAMSGGRVELGLGTGWFEAEHAAYGVPFPERRFGLLEEQLEIITGLWATEAGKAYSFEGEHYRLTESPALPKPVQSPHPPIIIGGGGLTRTPRIAARYADEFNANFQTVAEASERFERVREALAVADRPASSMGYSSALTVCCGRDDAEVARRAAAIGRDPDQLRVRGLIGTPSELADRIGAYAEAGVDTMYLQVLDLSDLDHLELIASEVAPQVTSL
jgi:F420-dependent oxidoreductase-like protein